MKHLNSVDSLGDLLSEIRKAKGISITHDVVPMMNVKKSWGSLMFKQPESMSMGRFLDLVKALDCEIYLEDKTGSPTQKELVEFVDQVLEQFEAKQIDAGAAVRKIKRKFNQYLEANE